MADDPNLPPAVDPAPPAPPAPPRSGSRMIVCEYCECTLTPAGEVMRRGERAAKLMKLEDRIEQLRGELERVQGELTTAQNELTQLRASQKKRFELPL